MKKALLILLILAVASVCYAEGLRTGMTKAQVLKEFGCEPDLKEEAMIGGDVYEHWVWAYRSQNFIMRCYFVNGKLTIVKKEMVKF